MAERMKTDLDHLPERKQWELSRIQEILFEEFDAATKGGTQEWRRHARIQSLILFGSHARGDWVDEPQTTKAYKSDYDLLIIVTSQKVIDMTQLWHDLEVRLINDSSIKTPVTFILETHTSVNEALRKGQYFFADIRREGIALFERPGKMLADPQPLTDKEAYEVAKEHFEMWFQQAQRTLVIAQETVEKKWNNEAAFMFHQATEHAYSAILLTLTNYSPSTHRIKALRSFSENLDDRLLDVWPSDTRNHTAWFNKLAEAYVKARYSKHYTISEEALNWLADRITHLHTLVNQICTDHLTKLGEKK